MRIRWKLSYLKPVAGYDIAIADAREAVKGTDASAEKVLPLGINGYHAACILAPGIIVGAAIGYSRLPNQ